MRRSRSLAILLATVLIALTCIGVWYIARRGPSRPRDVRNGRERELVALWHAPSPDGGRSGLSRVTIRVDPPRGGIAQVGFFESESKGTGDTWRAAGWMATAVASLTTGRHLESYVPSFTVAGRIDGPSAGALMAVGLIAALQDDPIAPSRTITGTINPDGTIGPVGGLIEKIDAAAEAGYGVVLVPSGQGRARSRDEADPMAHGHNVGITVLEVATIDEAYRLLTDCEIDAPPVSTQHGQVPEDVRIVLDELAGEWIARYEAQTEETADLRAQDGPKIDVSEMSDEAQLSASAARMLLSRGDAAGGYDRAVIATLQASVITELLRAVHAMWEPGPAGIEEPLRRSLDAEAIDDCGAQLARAPIGSTDDLLAVADGLGIVSQAKGLQLATDGLTRELRGTVSDDSLVRSATIAALNRHVLQAARDRLRLITPGAESSGGLSTDAIAWAHTMERAASANLAYFRSVSIEEMAKAMGLSVEAVTATMGSRDLTFVLAQASMTALPDLQDALPPGDAGDVAALGTSIGVYAQTSALIAKAYSLKLIIDERGDIRGVEDTASLDRLVEIAASSARANIAAAREAGLKTTVPSFYYIAARTYSDGSVDEKVEALQAYWQASLYARVGTLVEQAR